jgi:hypothetical protein
MFTLPYALGYKWNIYFVFSNAIWGPFLPAMFVYLLDRRLSGILEMEKKERSQINSLVLRILLLFSLVFYLSLLISWIIGYFPS